MNARQYVESFKKYFEVKKNPQKMAAIALKDGFKNGVGALIARAMYLQEIEDQWSNLGEKELEKRVRAKIEVLMKDLESYNN